MNCAAAILDKDDCQLRSARNQPIEDTSPTRSGQRGDITAARLEFDAAMAAGQDEHGLLS